MTMAGTNKPSLKIDGDAEVAYIKLSDNPVFRTVQATEDVLIDLDKFSVAVGIEVLDLDATIPYGRLTTDFHIHSDIVDDVRAIQPTINSFRMQTAPERVSEPISNIALVIA